MWGDSAYPNFLRLLVCLPIQESHYRGKAYTDKKTYNLPIVSQVLAAYWIMSAESHHMARAHHT